LSKSSTEIERLRDRVAELEHLLGISLDRPCPLPEMGSRPWQLVGLILNARGRVITRSFAIQALYEGRDVSDRTIDTLVSRANKAMRVHQVRIRVEKNSGYYLDEWSQKRLKKLIEGA
jgi:DNA-binding winged helix-turn-helix (wHTH) protein